MREPGLGGVIFDLDGVLLDSGDFHKRAWFRMADEIGCVFTEPFFREIFGQTNQSILPRMLNREASAEELHRLSERKEALFREEAKGHMVLFDGVLSLFEALQKGGFRQALGTSTPESNVRFLFETLGLEAYLDAYACGTDVQNSKPDPEVFLLAAERLGLRPDRCVVVEDATYGVQAANRGGFKCIAVTTTRTEEELRSEARPDLVVPDISHLSVESFRRLLS